MIWAHNDRLSLHLVSQTTRAITGNSVSMTDVQSFVSHDPGFIFKMFGLFRLHNMAL